MDVYNSIDDFSSAKAVVLTMGIFDGVHVGHQKIIHRLNELAKSINGISVLLSFDPHPRLVLQKNSDLRLLNSIQEKKELLAKAGLDALILHPFTKEFSRLSAVEFVRDCLVTQINVHTFVVGYDHHFGRNRSGNFDELQELAELYDFNLEKIAEIKTSEAHAISSTKIRNALQIPNLEYVNFALGRNFGLQGIVQHGEKLGRNLGFPTANLKLNSVQIVPKNGVYLVKVIWNKSIFFGISNIGNKPTVKSTKEKENQIETYIFDFNQDLYGQEIRIELLHFIREEKEFKTLDELKQQIQLDVANAIELKNELF